MTWLLVVIVVAVILFLILRNKPKEESAQSVPAQSAPQLAASAAPAYAVQDAEDDELLAVITAAVAEFEGGGEFQVVSIRPSGRNWAFTGRQELMQGRL
ncbi:MAG: OadG family protein [Negativicutes bacterium]|nr:OadG family protein [Negativicutes bacterium]